MIKPTKEELRKQIKDMVKNNQIRRIVDLGNHCYNKKLIIEIVDEELEDAVIEVDTEKMLTLGAAIEILKKSNNT